MSETLVSVKEIAPDPEVQHKTRIELREKRLIPFVRLGRLVRYNPQEVMKAIEKLTVKEHDIRKRV